MSIEIKTYQSILKPYGKILLIYKDGGYIGSYTKEEAVELASQITENLHLIDGEKKEK